MEDLLAALATSGLGRAMRSSLWLYPLANVVHVLGVAILFGTVLVADLRLLGLGRALPADALLQFLLPLAWTGFALAAVSGPPMFAADPLEIAANPFFRAKLLLLLAAGLNALMFVVVRRPAWRRTSAAGSLALWLAVLTCGRAIGYW